MADFNRIEDLANATAFDVDGDKVGGVKDVYVNDTTGQPDFVSVNHGLFGGGDGGGDGGGFFDGGFDGFDI